jgi:hypothetical protein
MPEQIGFHRITIGIKRIEAAEGFHRMSALKQGV